MKPLPLFCAPPLPMPTNPTQPTGSALAALSVAEGLTDAELSARIGERVAGWTDLYYDEQEKIWFGKDPKDVGHKGERGFAIIEYEIPPYATSADAVLPKLNEIFREVQWN